MIRPNDGWRPWIAIGLCTIVTFIGFVDRQILVLLAEPIKNELALSDVEVGALQGVGLILFAALATVPLGWLADRIHRGRLLSACLVLWSLATAACGLSQSFAHLLIAGAVVAIGEAGITPIVYSLIPQLFPGKSRLAANYVYFAANVVGLGVGLMLAGSLVAAAAGVEVGQFSDWRVALFLAAIPGPILALLLLWIRDDRASSHGKNRAAKGRGLLRYLRENWRTVAGVYGAMGAYGLALGSIFTWLPIAIIRSGAATASEVGVGFGTAMTAGSILGVAFGALGARYLKLKVGSRAPLRLAQIGFAVCLPVTLGYLIPAPPEVTYGLLGVQFGCCVAAVSLIPMSLQDMSPPHLTGQVVALSTVVYTIFQAASPVIVGALSEAFGPGALISILVAIATPALFIAIIGLRASEANFSRTIDAVMSTKVSQITA